MNTTKVCFVAAPLIARSGVYNSTIELVAAAAERGLRWSAIVGVSRHAAGEPRRDPNVRELELEPTGPRGVVALSRLFRAQPEFADADLIISMVPQSDMALALQPKRWVAYLRGLPWPAEGESAASRAFLWRSLERTALSRAREVWSTTTILASEVGALVDQIVPPGIVPPVAEEVATKGRRDFVWAARYSVDKNPQLFVEALRGSSARGVMYGSGPLQDQIRRSAPENVEVPGWVARDAIWRRARAYVGTSTREAFGRSAVEAAMLGIPVVLSDQFGSADMLFTDRDLAARFVLPVSDPSAWTAAIDSLHDDDDLHTAVSDHVRANATRLTVNSAVANVAAGVRRVVGG